MAVSAQRTGFGTACAGALRELRAAQKTAKGVSLYSRYVNRPLGRLLAAAAFAAGLRPNQVTALSAAFSYGALAALALLPPSWPLAVGVWLALAAGFALDSADGQLARLRGEAGPLGEWLDHVVDCAKITALHGAVLVSFYRYFDLPAAGWLLLPLLFQLAAVVTFFGGLLTDKLLTGRHRPPEGGAARPGQAEQGTPQAGSSPPPAQNGPRAAPSRLRAVALLPADYGVLCAVFLLLGDTGAFRAGYTLLCAAQVLFCGAFLVKWSRELSAVSSPRPG